MEKLIAQDQVSEPQENEELDNPNKAALRSALLSYKQPITGMPSTLAMAQNQSKNINLIPSKEGKINTDASLLVAGLAAKKNIENPNTNQKGYSSEVLSAVIADDVEEDSTDQNEALKKDIANKFVAGQFYNKNIANDGQGIYEVTPSYDDYRTYFDNTVTKSNDEIEQSRGEALRNFVDSSVLNQSTRKVIQNLIDSGKEITEEVLTAVSSVAIVTPESGAKEAREAINKIKSDYPELAEALEKDLEMKATKIDTDKINPTPIIPFNSQKRGDKAA